jgi:hypothetical protein
MISMQILCQRKIQKNALLAYVWPLIFIRRQFYWQGVRFGIWREKKGWHAFEETRIMLMRRGR